MISKARWIDATSFMNWLNSLCFMCLPILWRMNACALNSSLLCSSVLMIIQFWLFCLHVPRNSPQKWKILILYKLDFSFDVNSMPNVRKNNNSIVQLWIRTKFHRYQSDMTSASTQESANKTFDERQVRLRQRISCDEWLPRYEEETKQI